MVSGVTGVLRDAREGSGGGGDEAWRGWRRVRYPSEGVCAPWRWEREVARDVVWSVWCDVNGRVRWALLNDVRAHLRSGQATTEAEARDALAQATRQLALELAGAVGLVVSEGGAV